MTLMVRLADGARVPSRGSCEAAGVDLSLNEYVTIPPGGSRMCHTGVSVAIPRGFCGLVLVRSSVGARRRVRLSNSVGLIDSDYRGEIMLPLTNDGTEEQTFACGDRVAQLVVVPCVLPDVSVVDELPRTARGDGGFGSTGTR